jgi:Fic family protein
MNDLEIINQLHTEWQALQPLKPQDDKRLWKKFQLEWNYHSNHIEGNTLSYGETELLLVHGKVTGTHSVRDIEEMKAHDVAISHLRELAADTRPIMESDIRSLNQILLKESFWKDAVTADGKPAHIEIVPGEYKTQPNNVSLPDGDIFHFASPAEVPAKMQELVAWLLKALDSKELHPLQIATILHHRFVLIHPFGDGNGRTARLLVNYVLLRSAYPPLIVRTDDKAEYLATLQLADAGDLKPLEQFMAKALDWSLDIAIKAAKGKSIQEEDDLDKEIAIFVKNQNETGRQVVRRSKEIIVKLADESLSPLLQKILSKVKPFAQLFDSSYESCKPSAPSGSDDSLAGLDYFAKKAKNNAKSYQVVFHWIGYKGHAQTPFNITASVNIVFENYEYSIKIASPGQGGKKLTKKLYSEPLLSNEITEYASTFQEGIFNEIKRQSGQV